MLENKNLLKGIYYWFTHIDCANQVKGSGRKNLCRVLFHILRGEIDYNLCIVFKMWKIKYARDKRYKSFVWWFVWLEFAFHDLKFEKVTPNAHEHLDIGIDEMSDKTNLIYKSNYAWKLETS